MSAPTASFRVRLRFENSIIKPVLMFVDCAVLSTITQLKKQIRAKHLNGRAGSIKLVSDGFVIPGWETIEILRNNDVLNVSICAASSETDIQTAASNGIPPASEPSRHTQNLIHAHSIDDCNNGQVVSDSADAVRSEDTHHHSGCRKKKKKSKDKDRDDITVNHSSTRNSSAPDAISQNSAAIVENSDNSAYERVHHENKKKRKHHRETSDLEPVSNKTDYITGEPTAVFSNNTEHEQNCGSKKQKTSDGTADDKLSLFQKPLDGTEESVVSDHTGNTNRDMNDAGCLKTSAFEENSVALDMPSSILPDDTQELESECAGVSSPSNLETTNDVKTPYKVKPSRRKRQRKRKNKSAIVDQSSLPDGGRENFTHLRPDIQSKPVYNNVARNYNNEYSMNRARHSRNTNHVYFGESDDAVAESVTLGSVSDISSVLPPSHMETVTTHDACNHNNNGNAAIVPSEPDLNTNSMVNDLNRSFTEDSTNQSSLKSVLQNTPAVSVTTKNNNKKSLASTSATSSDSSSDDDSDNNRFAEVTSVSHCQVRPPTAYQTSTPADTQLQQQHRSTTTNYANEQRSRVQESQLNSGAKVFTRQRQNRSTNAGYGRQNKNQFRFDEAWSKDEQLNTTAFNRSFVLQSPGNPEETVTVTPILKDYSRFPTLDGPPRKGDKIAYKVLEISCDFTPVVSAYKEAEVLSYSSETKAVELKLSLQPAPRQQSTFKHKKWDDNDDDDDDGEEEEKQEEDCEISDQISLSLEHLRETRLIT